MLQALGSTQVPKKKKKRERQLEAQVIEHLQMQVETKP
jgi:hypothetical protein